MTTASAEHEELQSLIADFREGTLSAARAERLNAALAASPTARDVFARYAILQASLELAGGVKTARTGADAEAGVSPYCCWDGSSTVAPTQLESPLSSASPIILSPLSPSLSTTHYPLTTNFVGGPVFSYIAATLILGVMLLSAWAYKISHDYGPSSAQNSSSAKNSSFTKNSRGSTTPGISAQRPELFFVARVTGMKDCRWSDLQTETFAGAYVPLGRKYSLSSGLMEITYRSGAKVILEGPCSYEVESSAGGFLALGKLTARVESGETGRLAASAASVMPQTSNLPSPNGRGVGGEGSGNQSQSALTLTLSQRERGPNPNPKSQILNPKSHSPLSPLPSPLFTVRTPTAVVTDLGTEFGVEVKENGDVATHVFEGAVELEILGKARNGDQTKRIVAGESVRLRKSANGQSPTVIVGLADTAAFAVLPGQSLAFEKESQLESFRRWSGFSNEIRRRADLVAYYDFQRNAAEPGVLRDRAMTGPPLDGRIKGAVWVAGRFPGKQALYFHGLNCGNRVELPEQERFQFDGPFSAAVWFKVERFDGKWSALVTKGDTSWRLQQHEDADAVSFGMDLDFGPNRQTTTTAGGTSVVDGRWHLAVAVYEPGDGAALTRLYLDGRLEAENRLPQPVSPRQNNDPVWLGDNCAKLEPSREFQGSIDEAAFFAAALSAEEIAEIFQAGAPDRPMADGERR